MFFPTVKQRVQKMLQVGALIIFSTEGKRRQLKLWFKFELSVCSFEIYNIVSIAMLMSLPVTGILHSPSDTRAKKTIRGTEDWNTILSLFWPFLSRLVKFYI